MRQPIPYHDDRETNHPFVVAIRYRQACLTLHHARVAESCFVTPWRFEDSTDKKVFFKRFRGPKGKNETYCSLIITPTYTSTYISLGLLHVSHCRIAE